MAHSRRVLKSLKDIENWLGEYPGTNYPEEKDPRPFVEFDEKLIQQDIVSLWSGRTNIFPCHQWHVVDSFKEQLDRALLEYLVAPPEQRSSASVEQGLMERIKKEESMPYPLNARYVAKIDFRTGAFWQTIRGRDKRWSEYSQNLRLFFEGIRRLATERQPDKEFSRDAVQQSPTLEVKTAADSVTPAVSIPEQLAKKDEQTPPPASRLKMGLLTLLPIIIGVILIGSNVFAPIVAGIIVAASYVLLTAGVIAKNRLSASQMPMQRENLDTVTPSSTSNIHSAGVGHLSPRPSPPIPPAQPQNPRQQHAALLQQTAKQSDDHTRQPPQAAADEQESKGPRPPH